MSPDCRTPADSLRLKDDRENLAEVTAASGRRMGVSAAFYALSRDAAPNPHTTTDGDGMTRQGESLRYVRNYESVASDIEVGATGTGGGRSVPGIDSTRART